MRVKMLRRGTFLYRRSRKSLPKRHPSRGFWWFALQEGYGSDESYGPIISTYKVRRNLRLLNISTMEDRIALATALGVSMRDVSCNEQYAGGAANKAFHTLIRDYLVRHKLDGTFISEDEADDECEGATEVVLRLRPNAILATKV